MFEQGGILVFPTLSDEWGLVVNEAMAAGLPVLGSRYSEAVEEMVETDVTGGNSARTMQRRWTRRSIKPCVFPTSSSNLMRSAARERAAAFAPEKVADQVVSAARFVMRTAADEREDRVIVGRN